jgi:RNA polymerase sigma-70 factor (ECF subfamily)
MKKFKEFYTSQKDRLFGYLLRRTGNYQLSADIMQESFVKYLESYNKNEMSPALLFTISRNLLVDQFRRQRPETEFDESQHYFENNQEQQYMIREESRRVLAAIQQLDKDEADILALAVGSNLSYLEISKITNITESNVKIKIHRSRIKLKQILERGEK